MFLIYKYTLRYFGETYFIFNAVFGMIDYSCYSSDKPTMVLFVEKY